MIFTTFFSRGFDISFRIWYLQLQTSQLLLSGVIAVFLQFSFIRLYYTVLYYTTPLYYYVPNKDLVVAFNIIFSIV